MTDPSATHAFLCLPLLAVALPLAIALILALAPRLRTLRVQPFCIAVTALALAFSVAPIELNLAQGVSLFAADSAGGAALQGVELAIFAQAGGIEVSFSVAYDGAAGVLLPIALIAVLAVQVFAVGAHALSGRSYWVFALLMMLASGVGLALMAANVETMLVAMLLCDVAAGGIAALSRDERFGRGLAPVGVACCATSGLAVVLMFAFCAGGMAAPDAQAAQAASAMALSSGFAQVSRLAVGGEAAICVCVFVCVAARLVQLATLFSSIGKGSRAWGPACGIADAGSAGDGALFGIAAAAGAVGGFVPCAALCTRSLPALVANGVALNALSLAGVAVMLVFALTACIQLDVKRVFSALAASQAGLALACVGAGETAIAVMGCGAFALSAVLIALLLGSTAETCGTCEVARLGGLWHGAGLFACFAIAGSMCVVGVAPTLGFAAIGRLASALWHGGGLLQLALLVLAMIASASCVMRLLCAMFLGEGAASHAPKPRVGGVAALGIATCAGFACGAISNRLIALGGWETQALGVRMTLTITLVSVASAWCAWIFFSNDKRGAKRVSCARLLKVAASRGWLRAANNDSFRGAAGGVGGGDDIDDIDDARVPSLGIVRLSNLANAIDTRITASLACAVVVCLIVAIAVVMQL